MKLPSSIIALATFSALPTFAITCHPNVSVNEPQYIVGYGSLINTESKQKTALDTGVNIPVFIQGYQRVWSTPEMGRNHLGFTALGIRPKTQADFNGVIFNVSSKAIIAYDDREVGYCRATVNPKNIQILVNNMSLPSGQYWIYVNTVKNFALPSKKYPLIETYIDTVIAGCMDIGSKYHLTNYTAQCISSTTGWSKNWVNDRTQPIYPSLPNILQSQLTEIDLLLEAMLPQFSAVLQGK